MFCLRHRHWQLSRQELEDRLAASKADTDKVRRKLGRKEAEIAALKTRYPGQVYPASSRRSANDALVQSAIIFFGLHILRVTPMQRITHVCSCANDDMPTNTCSKMCVTAVCFRRRQPCNSQKRREQFQHHPFLSPSSEPQKA